MTNELEQTRGELERVKQLARDYLAAEELVVAAATRSVCDLERAEHWMRQREMYLRAAVAPAGGPPKDLSHFYCYETPCSECAAEKTPNV